MAHVASQWKSSKRDSTFFEQQQPNNEMNTPTPTPRTDAAWSATFDGEQMSAGRTARALREHSQQLETELAALTAERDQLRLDCDNETKWAAHYLAQSIADKARAERAEADLAALGQSFDDNCRGVVRIADELATERARLDSGRILLTVSGERVWHCGVDLRAAIDAGIKEDAK